MAYPSHIARTALRNALRNHPDRETVLNGERVNDLTLANLHHALTQLGVDPNAIVEAVRLAHGSVGPLGEDEEAPIMPADADTDADTDATIDAAIAAELQEVRSLIVTGGFSALDDKLRALVIEARKPAERIEVRVEVPVTVETTPGARPVHVAQKIGTAPWRKLFGIKGKMGDRVTALWDGTHPDTPRVNERYVWPHPATEVALSQIARGRNVMLFGPAGTGKSDWAQQIAARTGRPLAVISCDNGTDAATLVGMTVPDVAGGVTWQDGQLTRAIQTPGCVICLDEPSMARPGALFVMQTVLASRQLYIAETGRRIPVAPGVIFVATDNTNGTGGGARKGYTDTNRLNAAFLDRFGVRVKIEYLPADKEASVICSYTGCTPELAELLVSAATVTRAAEANQQLTQGIGLRRLLSWAELLTDGNDTEYAFQAAILNCAAEHDVETLREQCLLAYDTQAVARALNPAAAPDPVVDPAISNPTAAGRAAAADFTPV